METNEFEFVYEMIEDITRVDQLVKTGIFRMSNCDNPFVNSVFIEIVICLRDLLYKLDMKGYRINFTDDILVHQGVNDVTDLIEFFRNAVCHINSPNNFINLRQRCGFNILHGKASMRLGDYSFAGKYDDDICFNIGSQIIYIEHHIVRIIEEAKHQLRILYPEVPSTHLE